MIIQVESSWKSLVMVIITGIIVWLLSSVKTNDGVDHTIVFSILIVLMTLGIPVVIGLFMNTYSDIKKWIKK